MKKIIATNATVEATIFPGFATWLSPSTQNPVTIQDSDLSVEALTEILTEISGTDRQMLTRIVERWGSLSKDLKQAVLTQYVEHIFAHHTLAVLGHM